jgi:transcriptional regulator with XRE-family HTH domain
MAAMSVFGDFVKLRREELSMDQKDLARELGVQTTNGLEVGTGEGGSEAPAD